MQSIWLVADGLHKHFGNDPPIRSERLYLSDKR
jgi:hypothetical protein